MMRLAVPVVDRRGAGLGNELILWGKAYLAGQALAMRALHPAWGLNRRRYYRYFRTSRLDWFAHRLLRAGLPRVRFEEADYLRCGGGDFHDALVRFATERGLLDRSPLVLEIEGLWGGPGMLGGARSYLREQLYGTRWTADNLYAIHRRLGEGRLRVGVHVRRGDFGPGMEPHAYSGQFNVAVPLSWYENTMANLARALGDDVVFLVVSDASPDELAPLTDRFRCVLTGDLPQGDVSDMLALSECDFILCSISSFSMWAAFFGDGRYGWYAPQLVHRDGFASIWGHREAQQQAGSPLGHSRAEIVRLQGESVPLAPRGVPIADDGAIPDELIEDLRCRLWRSRRSTDLIRYGALPLA